MAKKTPEERQAALKSLGTAVFNFGLMIDAIEEYARNAGVKIHAETLKALHRHQFNLRDLVAHAQQQQ